MKKSISSKKALRVLMLVGVVLILAIAYYIANKSYELTSATILLEEENSLSSWVTGTSSSISLWTDDIEAQAKRISRSELYRLFASDASMLPKNELSLLNASEDITPSSSSDMLLAEQIPFMRSILLDFMNMSGLVDARIVDTQGFIILSAQARPIPTDEYQKTIAIDSIKNATVEFSPVLSSSAGLIIHMADPLKPVLTQDDEKPVAALLLTSPITGTIAQFLARDPQGKVINPYIVQKRDGAYETLSINTPRPTPVSFELDIDKSGVLPFALRQSFGNSNSMVWSLGISVPNLHWLIVAEIPAELLNKKLKSEAIKAYSLSFLVAIGIILGVALLWWMFIGREQKAVAMHFKELYQLINEQKNFLDNVNASLDIGLLVASEKGKILLINKTLKKSFHCEAEQLEGEHITYIFDPNFTSAILQGIDTILTTSSVVTKELKATLGGEEHLFRVSFFPFEDFSDEKDIKNTSSNEAAALITITDITEFRRQSDNRRKMQDTTMLAFISAVESMDPYLTGHSQRIKEIGLLVSKEMSLNPIDSDTLVMAATLSQIGKLFIPREILTKATPLTDEERGILQTIPTLTWELLKNVDFNLSASEALYQMYERLDGSGFPRHLKAEDISLHARILSVLNVFCAITAPRSYRNAKPPLDAINELRSNPDSYDQEIVEALAIVLKSTEAQPLISTPNVAE